MKTKPLISIIIPVYNAEPYLPEALGSVFDQTYPNHEIICINDGSTDGSLSLLKSWEAEGKIILIDLGENYGIAVARNKGIAAARGEFIAFLDADDIWKLDKLERQIQEFEKNPKLNLSFTYIQCFISQELPEEIRNLRYCPPEPQAGHMPGTLLMRKVFFDAVGEFNPELRLGEFIDWLSRAQSMKAIEEIIPDVLMLRRIHATNIGVRERDRRSDYLRVVKAALDRKRLSATGNIE